VAGISANVTSVAGVASDIPIVAANVADISNFADVYQGAKSTPPTLRNDGSALQIGDLYFNSVSNAMFVRASTGWVPAGSSVNGTSQRYRYIATSGQTTFTGADSNGNTLTYDAGFLDIYLNGVRLDSTDFTATSGTSIVLASGAALNDELNIVAFGTFDVAAFNGSGLIDGTTNISKLNATGTRSSSTFLAGDNTFKTVAVTPTAVSDQDNTSTGYFDLPSGTTAERPGSPVNGMLRYSTTFNKLEAYQNSVWGQFEPSYAVDTLVVGGGGGGGMGSNAGGGGGAGGYRSLSLALISGTPYAITVGAGGSGATGGASGGTGVSSSIAALIVSVGGGGGGGAGANGVSGASGGGGGSAANSVVYSGGSGTAGQGSNGGTGQHVPGVYEGAGGGGGAGANGANSSGATGGAGGVGLNWQSLGTFYAGGGGGSGNTNAAGGTGGGGAGSNTTQNPGGANTGGGGGGGQNIPAGAGGSGIVIIRYLGGTRGSGGTITSAGGYTYHTFTSSGTFTA
jgi:hypothetical protein